MIECAQLILKVTGSSSKIVFEPLPEDDPKLRCPDITKARTLLGWEPKIDLEEGIRLSLDYFRECLGQENGLPPSCSGEPEKAQLTNNQSESQS
jgi:hypothetical protein